MVDSTLVALRAQLAMMREYDARLLNTVYYTLTALGGVTLLLVGFGWWTNFRIYDRDRKAMRDELQMMFTDEARKVERTVADDRSATRELLRSEAREREQGFQSTVDASLEDTKEGLAYDIKKLREDLTEARLELAELRLERSKSEKSTWAIIPASITVLDLALRVNMSQHYRVSWTLETILKTLKDGVVPDAVVERNLVSALASVPSEYAITVDSIREALRKARAQ